ncbi:hypothetical protein CTI16_11305 [Prevotella intermedia]|uniref:Uncharacterized protein YyaB-like PH domain-containing protein n=1 Tax=Prevotella intermedia TaxID=28131 RepID=A0AAJ3RHR8_PREIN|nr:hypothetical protein CTI16_11305 [Prevotella intermedia]
MILIGLLLFFLFVILAALTLYPLGIKYTINGKVLSIHCPLFSTQVIDIFDILLIESTHTLDSSPAASIDRLKLTYKHGCVIISPKKKKDFVIIFYHQLKGSYKKSIEDI